MTIKFSREWAMPSHDTFSVFPIGAFVHRYLSKSKKSIDPFSRNGDLATLTNDINPQTKAAYHMDAVEFLKHMLEIGHGGSIDLAILDPPYSPRQISECYKEQGLSVSMTDTQSGVLYQKVKETLFPLLTVDAIVLSFGWNSTGMGSKMGFEPLEYMLVAHGGAHNDTICVAERRIPNMFEQISNAA